MKFARKHSGFALVRLLLAGCMALLLMDMAQAQSQVESIQPLQTPVRAEARFSEMDAIRADLNAIDQLGAGGGLTVNTSVIVGRNIKARDIYLAYIDRAAAISSRLIEAQKRIRPDRGEQLSLDSISLQELGAITQQLALENQRFKNSFAHGEDQFETYRLIETAILNLEDTIRYWRLSNHYRTTLRSGAGEQQTDVQVLQIKLQTAMNAIDELQRILETREALREI